MLSVLKPSTVKSRCTFLVVMHQMNKTVLGKSRTFMRNLSLHQLKESNLVSHSKEILWSKTASIDDKIKFYKTFKTSNSDLLEMIEVCSLTTNCCSMMKKEKEFKECLNDLKIYCSQLNDQTEKKLNEKMWNFIIQHFCKDESYHSYAIYLFNRITKETQLLPNPNVFTLVAILKVCATGSANIEFCEQIVNELESQGAMNVFSYTHFINNCIRNNDLEKGLQIILEMKRKGIEPNFGIYIPLLKSATNKRNIKVGMKIYQLAKQSNLASPQLSMTIISFLLKIRKPDWVLKEIEIMKQHTWMTCYSWNCLIQAYIQMSDIKKAIGCIYEMKDNNIIPDSATFNILITACADSKLFEEGKIILTLAANTLKGDSVEFSTSIINFYTKCGHPEIAIEECEKMKSKNLMNVVSWTCLIQAYIQNNQIQKATETIVEMKKHNITPNSNTFSILLTACANLHLFEEGKIIHTLATNTLKDNSIELSTSIINFYTKCGYPEIAIEECEKMKSKGLMNNVSIWNCLIQAYIQINEIHKASQAIHEMQKNHIFPNSLTFNILISACANLHLFEEGKAIHKLAIKTLKGDSVELLTSIINFYTKCGHPEIAIEECEKMKSKRLMDTISLNCLIQAYIQLKEIQKAIQTVREMKESGIHPDSATYTILLTACADSKLFEEGRTIHRLAARNLNGNSIELMTSIINFYTKCGRPEIAIKECERLKSKGLMNNTSMWNCLIQAYIQNNEIQKGIQIIHEMKDRGFNPDSISFTILLTACADLKLFEEGKLIHQLVTASKEKESVELFTATHSFYTKCGHPELAFR